MFNDLFDFDALFDQFWIPMSSEVAKGTAKYSVPSFPPCKAFVDKEGNMTFLFALAGYKKEDLNIDFTDNHMILSTVSSYKQETDKDIKIIVNNIKKPSFKYVYGVPETKFKFEETRAKLEDGILTIVIPPLEKKERKAINIK